MDPKPALKVDRLGRAALHSRVERWESDFKDHWNVRFYARDIQLAAEATANPEGGRSPGATIVPTRHLRFHQELFVNDPIEVRSAIVADGPYSGAIVHLLSWTKVWRRRPWTLRRAFPLVLPRVSAAELVQALPRSVSEAPNSQANDLVSWHASAELGPIRPAESDHRGALLWEQLMRRASLVSHRHFAQLGFLPSSREARASQG